MSAKERIKLAIPLSLFFGIVACFGDDAVLTSLNPAFASISAAFPDIPYSAVTQLYSFPKLIIIPLSLLSGYIAGRWVSFKTLALVGFAIIGFAGIAPTFLHDDFNTILALRMALGVGLGIQAPLGPALILRFFEDEKQRAFALGIGNGFINVYGAITNLLVGVLAAIDWRYCFLAYSTILVLFVIAIFCLKEPPKLADIKRIATETTRDSSVQDAEKTAYNNKLLPSLPLRAVGFCLLFFMFDCCWMPASLNASAIIQANNFGDAALTGVLISLINIAGMVAGFAFGFVFRLVKRYCIPLAFLIMACGLCFVFFASSAMMIAIGLFIGGFAFSMAIAGIQNELGTVCKPHQMALASALFMTCEHLGGFSASWYLALIMDVLGFTSFTAPVGFSIVIFLICTVLLTIYVKVTNNNAEPTGE